jgi:hypothetical protein
LDQKENCRFLWIFKKIMQKFKVISWSLILRGNGWPDIVAVNRNYTRHALKCFYLLWYHPSRSRSTGSSGVHMKRQDSAGWWGNLPPTISSIYTKIMWLIQLVMARHIVLQPCCGTRGGLWESRQLSFMHSSLSGVGINSFTACTTWLYCFNPTAELRTVRVVHIQYVFGPVNSWYAQHPKNTGRFLCEKYAQKMQNTHNNVR